jgi:hypothetical protein
MKTWIAGWVIPPLLLTAAFADQTPVATALPMPIAPAPCASSRLSSAFMTPDFSATQRQGVYLGPAYFSNFRRMYGATSVEIERGPVDSGDFVESNAMHRF